MAVETGNRHHTLRGLRHLEKSDLRLNTARTGPVSSGPFLHRATELRAPRVLLDVLRTRLALQIQDSCKDVFATGYLHAVPKPESTAALIRQWRSTMRVSKRLRCCAPLGTGSSKGRGFPKRIRCRITSSLRAFPLPSSGHETSMSQRTERKSVHEPLLKVTSFTSERSSSVNA